MQACNYSSQCPTPTASQLDHCHKTFVGMWCMCDEIAVYTSAMKLGYSEEEVRNINLTRTSSPNCTQRQDTGQDVWSWVRMQWVTITSLMPCNALYVPQHDAVSFSKSLNLPLSLPKESLHIYFLGISRHAGLILEFWCCAVWRP